MPRVAVLPGGTWGTALAAVAAYAGNQVRLWSRHPEVVEGINQRRENPRYLASYRLPRSLRASGDLGDVLEKADLVIFVPRSEGVRELAGKIRPYVLEGRPLVLSATKGLEPGSHLRMTQVIGEELGTDLGGSIGALSGPNFASEVARLLPTSTVVSFPSDKAALAVQNLLSSSRFRVYTNPDLVGVEMAGALKNVLALGTGIAHGAQLGYNAEAALITRGLSEITRLGVASGADVITFAGLAGLGDVVLSCTGEKSRNRQAGIRLGQGEKLSDITSGMTVEGVRTTEAVYHMGLELGMEMPIASEIYAIVSRGKSPVRAVLDLMKRERKGEFESLSNWIRKDGYLSSRPEGDQ